MKTGIVKVGFPALENLLHLPECWRIRSVQVLPDIQQLIISIEDETLPVRDGGELTATFRTSAECGHVESVTWKRAARE